MYTIVYMLSYMYIDGRAGVHSIIGHGAENGPGRGRKRGTEGNEL